MTRGCNAAALSFVFLFLLETSAYAADGDPIRSSDYSIDVFQGPVLGSSRAVGLSGAFSSIAEGVEGLLWNPAAVANRYPYSLSWWDYDIDVGALLPTGFAGQDFDNDGATSTDYDSFTAGLVGASLNFGYFGIGIEGSFQSYRVRGEETASSLVNVMLTTVHLDGAFALSRGQLVIGGGVRLAGLTLDPAAEEPVNRTGVGLEAGALFRPNNQPFRMSFVARTPVRPEQELCPTDPETAGFVLPCSIVVPWEIQIGFSWMLGPKKYNPIWVNPRSVRKRLERELRNRQEKRREAQLLALSRVPPRLHGQQPARLPAEETRTRAREHDELAREEARLRHERELALTRAPRRHVLLSADLVVTGPVVEGVGIESFVRQVEQRSGEEVSLAPRLGVESELWHDRFRLRGGSYLEPSRFRGSSSRPHATLGFDLRLFYTTLFDLFSQFGVRLSGVADIAPRYLQFAASVGIWH